MSLGREWWKYLSSLCCVVKAGPPGPPRLPDSRPPLPPAPQQHSGAHPDSPCFLSFLFFLQKHDSGNLKHPWARQVCVMLESQSSEQKEITIKPSPGLPFPLYSSVLSPHPFPKNKTTKPSMTKHL